MMKPAEYDAWYDTPRGRWIGETELRLLAHLLGPLPGLTLLDVGCGTGWFTRAFADHADRIVGLDVDADNLAFARSRASGHEVYVRADAARLPFADGAFDAAISVTALCFVNRWQDALAEIARVSRARFAIGLLHRCSALWLSRGRTGSAGAYSGAHWHTGAEIKEALRVLPVRNVRIGYAVFDPAASNISRMLERVVPSRVPLGSFLAVAADVAR
jgi:SAM-dependent methyltransferase